MPVDKVFFKNSAGQKLAGWLHVPDKQGKFPAVIRTHGYRSSKEGRTSLLLADHFKDVVYLRFDMHGHGESEGNPDEINAAQCGDDMVAAVNYVSGLPFVDAARIGVTGSSLGGMATILAAAWHPSIKAAVPVCPVSDFHPFKKSEVHYQPLVDKLGVDNLYKEAEKITCSVFIIHGDHDTVVQLHQSMGLIRHLRHGTLHIIPGADHIFSNEKHFEQMIEQTADFLREHLIGGVRRE